MLRTTVRALVISAWTLGTCGTFGAAAARTQAGPPSLTAVQVKANAADSGYTGAVTLSAFAPAGGAVVTLASSTAFVVAPPSVTVPAGQRSATFAIDTSQVTAPTSVTIQASYGGGTFGASFLVSDTVVAYRTAGSANATFGASNGVDTSQMVRTEWTFPRACRHPQAVYRDFYLFHMRTVEGAGSGPLQIYAALEYPASSGRLYPFTFRGAASGYCNPAGSLVTDPLPLTLPAGAIAQLRTFVSVAPGGKWPYVVRTNHRWDEGASAPGVAATNLALAGSGPITPSNADAFDAYTIIGRPSRNADVSVVGIGDSVGNGTGDEVNLDQGQGFLFRAFIGSGAAYLNLCHDAAFAADFLDPARCQQRKAFLPNARYMVCELGRKDVSSGFTLAKIKAALGRVWTDGWLAGMVVYQTTVTPITASTDHWLTVSNQSNNGAGNAQPNESLRQQLNQWLRAPASAGAGASARADFPDVLDGVIDVDAAVEANADGSQLTISADTGAIANGAGGYWLANPAAYGPIGPAATVSGHGQVFTDSTANWTVNEWAGYMFAVQSGVGASGPALAILSNTATTLTFAAPAPHVDSTSVYVIADLPTADGQHPSPRYYQRMANAVAIPLLFPPN